MRGYVCNTCRKAFEGDPNIELTNGNTFCSNECSAKWAFLHPVKRKPRWTSIGSGTHDSYVEFDGKTITHSDNMPPFVTCDMLAECLDTMQEQLDGMVKFQEDYTEEML